MIEEERAPRYSDLFDSGNERTSDCSYCPFCATVAIVRRTRPEILEHVSAAARELLLAAGLLLEEASDILTPPEARDDAARSSPRSVDGG